MVCWKGELDKMKRIYGYCKTSCIVRVVSIFPQGIYCNLCDSCDSISSWSTNVRGYVNDGGVENILILHVLIGAVKCISVV